MIYVRIHDIETRVAARLYIRYIALIIYHDVVTVAIRQIEQTRRVAFPGDGRRHRKPVLPHARVRNVVTTVHDERRRRCYLDASFCRIK